MNRIMIAAVSMLMISSLAVAHAESNDLAAVEHPATTGVVLSSPAAVATGSESYPDFVASQSVPVTAGGVLAATGSDGPVQTANSLPPGFTVGTEAANYAASVQRSFAAQAERARIAARSPAHHAG